MEKSLFSLCRHERLLYLWLGRNGWGLNNDVVLICSHVCDSEMRLLNKIALRLSETAGQSDEITV